MGKNKIIKNNDVSPTSELPKKDHTKSANVIIFVVFMFLIVLTVLLGLGIWIYQPYVYHTTMLAIPVNMTWSNGESKMIYMDLIVQFTTSSLSAQNPIDVNVKLFPHGTDLQNHLYYWSDLPDPKEFAIFPDSLDFNQTGFANGIYQTGRVELIKQSNPDRYEGNSRIIYQFESKYGYFFVSYKEMLAHTINGYQHLNSTEFGKRIVNASYFPVGSSDFTTTIRTNNMVNALTLVLIMFGIFETKSELRKYLILVIKRFRG